MRIGTNIKKLRELKGLSQENIADELGMSVTGYGRIERNEVDVNMEKLGKISEVLGIKIEDIISFDDRVILSIGGQQTIGQNNSPVFNTNVPDKLLELYEDKIKLMEEKMAWMQKEIDRLSK